MRVAVVGAGSIARTIYLPILLDSECVLAALGHFWEMIHTDAQRRFDILKFWGKHGLAATCDAFGVSRRTLFRWKKAFSEAAGNPAALAPRSTRPKRVRTPQRDPRLIDEIRRLRQQYPNLGKDKLHGLLSPWCAQHGIPLPSASTLGRLNRPRPGQDAPCAGKNRSKRPRKTPAAPPKPRKPKGVTLDPLEVLACDTIERIRDGVRRTIVTFIDPASHFAFAWATPTKHARHPQAALKLALSLLPKAPKRLLSDNGSELEADFAQALKTCVLSAGIPIPKPPG